MDELIIAREMSSQRTPKPSLGAERRLSELVQGLRERVRQVEQRNAILRKELADIREKRRCVALSMSKLHLDEQMM